MLFVTWKISNGNFFHVLVGGDYKWTDFSLPEPRLARLTLATAGHAQQFEITPVLSQGSISPLNPTGTLMINKSNLSIAMTNDFWWLQWIVFDVHNLACLCFHNWPRLNLMHYFRWLPFLNNNLTMFLKEQHSSLGQMSLLLVIYLNREFGICHF